MSITQEMVTTPRLDTHVRQAGQAGKPVVILIHGNASSSAFFDAFITGLATDFHVVAPDFRAFGDSERLLSPPGGLEDDGHQRFRVDRGRRTW